MPRYSCPFCPQSNFTSLKAVDNHIKERHLGRMSDSSVEYLLRQGVPAEKILKYGATPEQIERVKRRMGQLTLSVFEARS